MINGSNQDFFRNPLFIPAIRYHVLTEVNEGPLDALLLVLLLLLDEHVVVEELLEALVGVINQKLLQSVQLENLETGNVQDTFFLQRGEGKVEFVDSKV